MITNIVSLRDVGNDAEVIFNIRNEQLVLNNIDATAFKNIGESISFLDTLKNNEFSFAKIITYNKEVVGLIYLNSFNKKHHNASITFFLASSYWNKKIMQTALLNYLKFVTKEFVLLHRIEAYVLLHNLASKKILLNLGFKEEGLTRENFLKHGIYCDCFLLSYIKNKDDACLLERRKKT